MLHELSTAVRVRRSDIGLTQAKLAGLCELSRATINQVENGSIKDLSVKRATRLLDELGLAMHVVEPRTSKRLASSERTPALKLAARSASVSYKQSISEGQLADILVNGDCPPDWVPHVFALLDEAPVSLLAGVVEQIHIEYGQQRSCVWQTMRKLARSLKSVRPLWQ